MLRDGYKQYTQEEMREFALMSESHHRKGSRVDHYMASLLPSFDPSTDCIFPLVRRPDGSAAFFCQFCRCYHHHGQYKDFESGIPEGRMAHCDPKKSPMTHYFVVRPKAKS